MIRFGFCSARPMIGGMWQCSKCSERHADHFSVCWRCAGLEAPPRTVQVNAPVVMDCARCHVDLRLLGSQSLEGFAVEGPGTGLATFLAQCQSLDVYLCPRCGQLALFAGGTGDSRHHAEAGSTTAAAAPGFRAERLLQEASQLETREDIKTAIRQYEDVMTKYPGTSYAREAERNLCRIRTRLGI